MSKSSFDGICFIRLVVWFITDRGNNPFWRASTKQGIFSLDYKGSKRAKID